MYDWALICDLKWIYIYIYIHIKREREIERSVANFYLFLQYDDHVGFRVYKPIIALE
jgi:hypothetical protein